METYLIGLLAFCFFAFNPQTNYYQPKWWFLIQATIVLLCYHVYLLSSPFMGLFSLYILSSANYYTSLQFNHFNLKNHKHAVFFSGSMGKSLTCTTSIILLFALTPMHFIRSFLVTTPVLLLLGSLFIFIPAKYRKCLVFRGIHAPFKKPKGLDAKYYMPCYHFGYGANASSGATFLSLLAPLTLFNLGESQTFDYFIYITLALTFIAILMTKASAGLGGFIAGAFTYSFYTLGLYTFIPLAIFLISIYFINKQYQGKLFALSGRDGIWKFAYKHLRAKGNYSLIGQGVGAFGYLFPSMQMLHKDKKEFPTFLKRENFIWAHCDPFQFFVDGGYIGILLLLFLAVDVAGNSYGNPVLMCFFASYVVNSFTNFNNHLAADSTLLIFMLRLSYGL